MPQGDSLFPVMFVIAALRSVRNKSPPRPAIDTSFPSEIPYADDIDFVSTYQQWLKQVQSVAKQQLGECNNLKVFRDKTDHTRVVRGADRIEKE